MKFLSNVRELFHTLRHVKPVQVSYRLKYGLKRIHSLKKANSENLQYSPLSMLPIPTAWKYIEITENGIKATFLNKSVSYHDRIQWDDIKYGKLWNYHLQYADFLKQGELSIDFRTELVLDLYRWLEQGKLQPEAYPASLRIMNVIRFLSENSGRLEAESDLVGYLNSELHYLQNRIEYHLLGNHLMENAFALLMGGVFFHQREWILIAKKIFGEQLAEQVLDDGAHFERSPMYHLILLFRFLEAIYYLPSDSKLSSVFIKTSKKMLGWIDQMSFRNGGPAHFNDSTDGQSYSKNNILEMADSCGIRDFPKIQLSDSGYRKFTSENFEIIIDAGGIEPSYQPGHAHADSLSFVLHVDGQPVISDPGISTYETGERRDWERASKAHNTVTFKGQNTADVWSRFRVGRRPEVIIKNQTSSEIEIFLQHKLRTGENFEHQRNFMIEEEFIEIKDVVNLEEPVQGRLYFDPAIRIKTLDKQRTELENGVLILLNDVQHIREISYDYCMSFNSRKVSSGIEYDFIKQSSLKFIAPKK